MQGVAKTKNIHAKLPPQKTTFDKKMIFGATFLFFLLLTAFYLFWASTEKPKAWDNWDINQKITWLEALENPDDEDLEELMRMRADEDKNGTDAKYIDEKNLFLLLGADNTEHLHRLKRSLIKKHLRLLEREKIGMNPNLLFSRKGHLIFRSVSENKKSVNTGTALKDIKRHD